MFHYDRGLKITGLDLAVDFTRRQPRGFISHAHTDHMAKHELAFCTPATAKLYHARQGQRPVSLLPYGQPYSWGEHRLTTFPAGHILGSAMLLVEHEAQSLLYTGDFKLGESATADQAAPPLADILVMESTFGDPKYRLPSRQEVISRLIQIIASTLDSGRTPVVHAYVLGKSQEVTKILTDQGFPVLQHPLVYEMSEIYELSGCHLGKYACYDEALVPGSVVVAPPRRQKAQRLKGLIDPVSIAVTGWANDPAASFRLGVDHALPLSDHADYRELLELIDLVEPSSIYCTHGPVEFVQRLKTLGHNAFPLAGGKVKLLF